MNCPICKVELKMAERQGVEIDYCPQCRGVWLDRGELDKIIELSTIGRLADDRTRRSTGDRDDEDREEQGYPDGQRKRKRGGFLGDLLDFGGD